MRTAKVGDFASPSACVACTGGEENEGDGEGRGRMEG